MSARLFRITTTAELRRCGHAFFRAELVVWPFVWQLRNSNGDLSGAMFSAAVYWLFSNFVLFSFTVSLDENFGKKMVSQKKKTRFGEKGLWRIDFTEKLNWIERDAKQKLNEIWFDEKIEIQRKLVAVWHKKSGDLSMVTCIRLSNDFHSQCTYMEKNWNLKITEFFQYKC